MAASFLFVCFLQPNLMFGMRELIAKILKMTYEFFLVNDEFHSNKQRQFAL